MARTFAVVADNDDGTARQCMNPESCVIPSWDCCIRCSIPDHGDRMRSGYPRGSKLLHFLRTQRHSVGIVILITLFSVWFTVPMQACITMANVATSVASLPHSQHDGLDSNRALTDADTSAAHPCSTALCSTVEGLADQLSKQPSTPDVIKALLLSMVFWILPAPPTLGFVRLQSSFATPLLKLPPALKFRVLLI